MYLTLLMYLVSTVLVYSILVKFLILTLYLAHSIKIFPFSIRTNSCNAALILVTRARKIKILLYISFPEWDRTHNRGSTTYSRTLVPLRHSLLCFLTYWKKGNSKKNVVVEKHLRMDGLQNYQGANLYCKKKEKKNLNLLSIWLVDISL